MSSAFASSCLAGRQRSQRELGRTGAIGLELATGPRPDVVGRQAVVADQRLEYRATGFRRFEHGQPELLRLIECRLVTVRQPRLLVIAGDIRLGRDQLRVFDNDLAPVAALAQPANPVGTQFLGDVAAARGARESRAGPRYRPGPCSCATGSFRRRAPVRGCRSARRRGRAWHGHRRERHRGRQDRCCRRLS